jgi:hypothetical protein
MSYSVCLGRFDPFEIWFSSTRTWLSGRASPCQGEGRGFESRRPLGSELNSMRNRSMRLRLSALIGSDLGGDHLGGVAERRGNGLQIRLHGFESRLHLGDVQREAVRAIGAGASALP